MDLLQMKAFVLSARYQNFSQAANHMYISQSSISKYISALESELGFPLFNRNGKAITLTRFGEDFLPYVERVLEAESDTQEFIQQQKVSWNSISIGLAGELQDGSNIAFFRAYINAVHKFTQTYPNVSIQTRFYPSHEMFSLIRTQKISAGAVPILNSEFEASFPESAQYHPLNHTKHFLALGPGLEQCTSLETIGKQLKTIYYLPNDVSRKILDQLLPSFPGPLNLRVCEYPMELLLRISSREPFACSLVESHLVPMFYDLNTTLFPLSSVQIGSALYLVWEKVHDSPYFPLFGKLISKYLQLETTILETSKHPPYYGI